MGERRDYQLLWIDDLGTGRGKQRESCPEWTSSWKGETAECTLFQYILLVKVKG